MKKREVRRKEANARTGRRYEKYTERRKSEKIK
jgi:hypothetical protein